MNEPLVEAKKTRIVYQNAKFHRRVFGNFIDFFCFALLGVGLFLLTRLIVTSTPGYQEKENAYNSYRYDSGLYIKTQENQTFDIVSYLNEYGSSSYFCCTEGQKAIDTFLVYIDGLEEEGKANEGAYQRVYEDWNNYLYQTTYDLNGTTYPFFKDDEQGELIPMVYNELYQKIGINAAKVYFDSFYSPFIDDHLQGYLITLIPEYLSITRFQTIMLAAVEIPIAATLSSFIVYVVPVFFWRRGCQTFGKWTYRIGLADSRLLSCSIPRYIARWAIFYFGELVLSVFTFGIPFIISVSMMAFSKRKQGFPDYVLGLHEVDLTYNKLYFSYEEISLLGVAGEKKPVDFKNTYEN